MANLVSPVPCVINREIGHLLNFKNYYFNNRLQAAKGLYNRNLVCHYGCVNAIEFSSNGELLVSGGDDRRIMLWKFGHAILDKGTPECMIGQHQSNVFCLGITTDNQVIYSGANDDTVIVHDVETKRPIDVLQHQRAVSGLSINPMNEKIVATAGSDGRLVIFDTRVSLNGLNEPLVVSRSRKVYHSVMYNPVQEDVLVSANAKEGVALWDLRNHKHAVIKYLGNHGSTQNSMSVRFNSKGTRIVALRRRLLPVLYNTDSPEPLAEFYHQDYYNSCTMKSCCFAGEGDRYIVSGSDDFNLYVWKVPEGVAPESENTTKLTLPTHVVLYGHRSIVNQVRYNPHFSALASSGVEKIIKVWSTLEYPSMRGDLLTEVQGSDNPREIYSHEDYVTLVHHSGPSISHNYSDQSTSEDPRMMAFFDSLVQRELECVAEDTDGSSDGFSSSSPTSVSSDGEQFIVDFLPLPPKRHSPNATRQRLSNRIARLVASRCAKNIRAQKRLSQRRAQQSRTPSKPNGKCAHGTRGKRAMTRTTRQHTRRAVARAPLTMMSSSRISAPSSERTDSDEPAHFFRHTSKSSRPLRRRMNLSRAAKRKSKAPTLRKRTRSNGSAIVGNNNNNDNNFMNFDHSEDNLSLPSTSTGYRGQNSLFRIAEVDSDDDQSVGSPVAPRNVNGAQEIPPNLVSIIPTPINGSRDNLGESLRGPLETERRSPPQIDTRLRSNIRRLRRNGRPSLHQSDSSESPPPKESTRQPTAITERLAPKVGHSRTVARLMNETNESEMESSCSTEGSFCPRLTADGASTSRIPLRPVENATDEPEHLSFKFRQRAKKARRNYRNHIDSDSN